MLEAALNGIRIGDVLDHEAAPHIAAGRLVRPLADLVEARKWRRPPVRDAGLARHGRDGADVITASKKAP